LDKYYSTIKTRYGALSKTDMKDKFVLKIGIILFCISLNFIQNKALSQDRYLMVLDIQMVDKDNKQLDSSVKEMIINVNSLISHLNPEKVIYIKATSKAMNLTSKGFSVVTLPAPDFDSTLNIVSNNIFTKIEGDAFTSPELISFLENRKVKEIVLVGLMAEKCLYNTALGGNIREYDIKVVPEGIVGTTQKKKTKAIEKMKAKGIKIIPITEIINAL
jgi:nicotinamidase-related amidase